MKLDHIAVAGMTRDAATQHVQQALDAPLQPGGEHDVFHTHNTLMGLEAGLYLEAIAINPHAPQPNRPRWFDLDRFSGPPRLTNWICRCDDLAATLAALPDGFGTPVQLQRGDLRWQMAVPQDGLLPFDNCAPALIQWEGTAHPAARLTPSGCRLQTLTITHPRAEELADMLAPHLDDPRVQFEPGSIAMQAEFETSSGARVLR